ncbi:Pol Polyprotein [Phytophthora cinnamomi]|nr:Pol Polyprotein [Phytophthora cinnamomi]
MDNTHVRLVKDLKTSYEIFQAICAKYEGAAFHGDPYFIQHYLMELKYEEGGDLDDFFLKLENAMNATSEATESVMTEGQKSIYLFHALPKSWKDDLRVWKGQRKYIPYGELKTNIEQKVREIQAEERYTLAKRHAGEPSDQERTSSCRYTQCRSLQKDLREGRVKAGTVLPANFAFKGGDSNRSHPYRNNKNSSRGRNNGSRGNKDRRDNRSDKGKDNDKRDSGNERKVYNQERRETTGLIAVVATVNPAISLTAQATVSPEPTWTIDSGCTRHVTHESQWFSTITASDGSITVGGKNEIPIEGIGKVELEVIDSKGTKRTLTLHDVLYAPELKFSLLSVPAAVKHDFRFSFDRKLCAVQTDAKFKIKAMMATHADLYQFQAKPVMKHEALIAHSGAKPFVE